LISTTTTCENQLGERGGTSAAMRLVRSGLHSWRLEGSPRRPRGWSRDLHDLPWVRWTAHRNRPEPQSQL